jgi:hypothetical protein
VLFAALYFRHPNPKLQAKLFNWVGRGPQRRLRRLHHYRLHARLARRHNPAGHHR